MALRTHLSNLDSLINLHDSRLYVLERTFQQEVKKMQEDFKNEKENMLNRFKNEKRLLTTVIEAIEKEEEERESDVRLSFQHSYP